MYINDTRNVEYNNVDISHTMTGVKCLLFFLCVSPIFLIGFVRFLLPYRLLVWFSQTEGSVTSCVVWNLMGCLEVIRKVSEGAKVTRKEGRGRKVEVETGRNTSVINL